MKRGPCPEHHRELCHGPPGAELQPKLESLCQGNDLLSWQRHSRQRSMPLAAPQVDSFPNPNWPFRERPQTKINVAFLPSHRSPDSTHSRLPQEDDLLKGTRCPASNKSPNQHSAGDVPACVASLLTLGAGAQARSPQRTPFRLNISQKTCRFGRPLSYSWVILFDVMDCLHVSVSNCKLHFFFLSTILIFTILCLGFDSPY